MPVPKKNHSSTRQNKRRANWKGKVLALVACGNCGVQKRPHHVCRECGYYNGKQFIQAGAAQE